MSAGYSVVQWTPWKARHDALLVAGLAVVLAAWTGASLALRPQLSAETLLIRGTALAAFLLLHVVLVVGPLARLDRRFLPLLYNRRHLGVATFALGAAHATLSIVQFHAWGDASPLVSALSSTSRDALFSDAPGSTFAHVPFEPFGALALVVLFLMAATSHDFWLKNLGASAWKALHLLVFAAYGALVAHVALGVLQSERAPLLAALPLAGACAVLSLHVAAAQREARVDSEISLAREDGFHDAGAVSELAEGRGRVAVVAGRRLALFLVGGRVHATSNACRHQGGPLGEGRVKDGCITCPWHGWQYRPEDGCSPPPFQEVVETHDVRVVDGRVLVRPEPRPLRTRGEGALA